MASRPGSAGQPAAPRYALGFAALACMACTLALGYPALSGDFLVSPISEQYATGYAFREFAASVLKDSGRFPLWNPYVSAGLPYVATAHGDVFYPTFLLRMALRTDAAITWGFIIHVWLCGVFTYGFLRAYGFGFYGAMLGGVAYELSGQVASLAAPGHDGRLHISALLPLALWMLVRGIRDGKAASWAVLALTVGLAVLSANAQLLQYMLLTCAAFATYLVLATGHGRQPERRVAIRRVAFSLAAVALGGLIGAIQYVPAIEYLAWSPRAGGVGNYAAATALSMPVEELLNSYLPHFTGILDHYWGRNGVHHQSQYVGASVLLLSGAGLLPGRDRRSFAHFWLGVLVVALLWALGGNTPFYRLVYAVVPGTNFFTAPGAIFFLVAFAAAVLACIGAERVLERDVGLRYYAVCVAVAGAVALVGVGGGLTNVATAVAAPDRYELVAANEPELTRGVIRSLVFVAVTAGVGIAYLRGHLSQDAAALSLVAVVGTDLWTVARRYWLFSPPAVQVLASDPTIDYVRRQREPGRVLALQLSDDAAPRDPFLRGDALMAHRVRQALGYHGNDLGRYRALASKVENLGNPNFWALANVHYMLTNVAQPPVEGAIRVVGPVKNASGSTVYLYRVPGENPGAWVAPSIATADDSSALATLLDPLFPVRSVALFDTAAAVRARTGWSRPTAALDIRTTVTRYDPGRISVSLDAPAPEGSALVVSESYYPGWQARVDGRPVPVERANYVFMGVALPEGARSIDLTFESRAVVEGGRVTRLALGATALTLLAGLLADRRRRA